MTLALVRCKSEKRGEHRTRCNDPGQQPRHTGWGSVQVLCVSGGQDPLIISHVYPKHLRPIDAPTLDPEVPLKLTTRSSSALWEWGDQRSG